MDKRENLKIVKLFKKIVSEKLNIQKLILFGSRARGDFKKDSDFDLIVVSDEFVNGGRYKRAPDIYRAWNMDYPVDFLCYTQKEFNKLKNRVTIVREAVKEGIEI